MDQFSIPEFVFPAGNLILLLLSILVNFYQFSVNRKEKVSYEIANNVINHFFLPFQRSLGIHLYKKITFQNWQERRIILISFREQLDQSKESYYLSDSFLLSMDGLRPYLEMEFLSKEDLKLLNKKFQKFSKKYLKEHSYFREKLHLLPKRLLHRLSYKLFPNELQLWYSVAKFGCVLLIFIVVYFTIVSYFLLWSYQLFYS